MAKQSVSPKTLAQWQQTALLEALGHVLALADPDDSDVLVGSIHDDGSDDRHIREAVKPYLMSWVAEPLSAALGVGPLHPYATGTRRGQKAREYLARLKEALAR